ncbi:hypothetical protein [Hyphomonas sp.]|uniref:hypothetical protein n=1 Tax=Hyphomonas sp. TaxID=87 RepID=UPI00391C162B
MSDLTISALAPGAQRQGAEPVAANSEETTQLRLRFEQMLWSEMLSHAGLEKAFTQGGGEGAASFSRFIVEAIAKDLAEKHPLGFGEKALPGTTPAAIEVEKPE